MQYPQAVIAPHTYQELPRTSISSRCNTIFTSTLSRVHPHASRTQTHALSRYPSTVTAVAMVWVGRDGLVRPVL